jgi:thiol-disulfide isomerase/thioredoxin
LLVSDASYKRCGARRFYEASLTNDFTERARIVRFALVAALEIHLDRKAKRGKNRLAAGISIPEAPARTVWANEIGGFVADSLFASGVEGKLVRSAVGVAVMILSLGLMGCSLFGKKQAAHTNNNSSKPFLGSEKQTKTEIAALPSIGDGPLQGANGFLAGRVVAEDTERPVRVAYIQVKDPEEKDSKAAPLEVLTVEGGYFTICSLKPGKQYELVARAEEGGELISCIAYAKPPNATLFIRLHKRFTTSSTPKLPDMPTKPPGGKKDTPATESSRESTPAASLEAPTKLPDQTPAPRGGLGAPVPSGAGETPNPANIAANEFLRLNPSSPQPANIPSPPPVPGTPSWEKVPDNSSVPIPPAVPGSPGSVRLPNVPTPVPSCGLYGDRLNNFALRDLDGNVWEYKRDHRGRLTLLDFWYHSCGPCLKEIPNLIALQRDYKDYGLEVVSIACETGTLEEQRRNVRSIRNRYQMNYKVLLSGDGGPERCPVIAQFQVALYPTLVLLDANGTIVWRSGREGMDDYAHHRLRKAIDDHLVTKQAMP